MAKHPDNGIEKGNGHALEALQRTDFRGFGRLLRPGVIAQRVRHDVSSGVSIIKHIMGESARNGHESLDDLRAKFFHEDQDQRGRAELALQIIQMSINDPKKLDRVASYLDLAVVAMGGDYVQPKSKFDCSTPVVSGNGHNVTTFRSSESLGMALSPTDRDWYELAQEEPQVREAIVAGWQDTEAAKA